MAYIRFAKEEKELFKLLFMRDRSHENMEEINEAIKTFIEILKRQLGICEEDAHMLHPEMWMYAHGIAATIATSYLEWDEEFISRALS